MIEPSNQDIKESVRRVNQLNQRFINAGITMEREKRGSENYPGFVRFPDIVQLFESFSKVHKVAILRAAKGFDMDDFYAYLILLKEAKYPKVVLIDDTQTNLGEFFNAVSATTRLKCYRMRTGGEFVRQFSREFQFNLYDDQSTRNTLMYLSSCLFGEEVILEYLKIRKVQAPETNLIDMIQILSEWSSHENYPLFWAFNLFEPLYRVSSN